MNRITSAFGILSLATISAVAPSVGAQSNDLELLKTRVSALESRVAVLENAAANGSTNVVFNTPAPAVKKPAELETYVIKEGDTISEVARRFNVPRTNLMDENGLREGQQIYIGDEIRIPSQPSATPPATTPSNANLAKTTPKQPATTPVSTTSSGTEYYTVKYGDTLSKIARAKGVSVAAIKSANGLKSDIIGGGQRLKIPSNGTSTPGATLVSDTKPETPKKATPSLPSNETYGEYTVEKGDNLYALARDFFTTMKHLQQLNGLGSSTLIRPGEKLVVPTSKYNEYHNKVANR